MSADRFLFEGMDLPSGLARDIARANPWWQGYPMQVLPNTRRHLVKMLHQRLERHLTPIVVLRGPRQVGKTTAQLHVISDLLERDVAPERVIRVQCDELPELTKQREPILRIVDWYERAVLKRTLNQSAHMRKPAYLFLDEVQNLRYWDVQLKYLADHSTVATVVTGSSALRIGMGRDSLAGRINTLECGVLSLTEIGAFAQLPVGEPFLRDNGLEALTDKAFWRELANHGEKISVARDTAFSRFSERGGYPLAQGRYDVSWEYVADQLNDTVIRRVIQHDLRVGERGRKRDAALLEEVFRLACRYVGQAPAYTTFAREAHRALQANVGPQRINQYLRFLNDTLLLRLIPPLEIRLKRSRGFPKICLADHGLRASWLQEVIPLTPDGLAKAPHLTTMAGHLAESVVGALLATISGLDLAYCPARRDDAEVDFVLTIGDKRIPAEVKYQRAVDDLRDTESLRAFIETKANNAPFGLLVTQTPVVVADPRIVAIPLSSLMLLR